MNLPPLRNPLTRLRAWAATNRAQVEIMVIAGIAIGMIVIMVLITIVIVYRLLR